MIWDTATNLQEIRRRVTYLTQGCKCRTGCDTHRCKCRKGGLRCGPSCRSINCRKILQFVPQLQEAEEEVQEEILEGIRYELQDENHEEYEDDEISGVDEETSSDEEQAISALDMEVDDIMEEVFGMPC